jgi:hypothetical protein
VDELAVIELEFYKNRNQHLQDIENRLEEIDEDYLQPSYTYYDSDEGRMRVVSRSVEDAVIWKIEAEEALVKTKERVIKRCNRIVKAFNQLDQEEQTLLAITYLDDGNIQKLLSYREMAETKRKVRQALLKFYRGILQQKRDKRNEKMVGKVKQYLEGRETNGSCNIVENEKGSTGKEV